MTKRITLGLLFPILILLGFSIVALTSISQEILYNQLFFLVIGATFFLTISRIDYRVFTHFPWFWYCIAIGILILTLLFGNTVRGSTSWLAIGSFTLQPSEFAKPLMILFTASYFTHIKPKSFSALLVLIGIVLLPLLLIYLQPDFGSTVIVAVTIFGVILASGLPWKYFIVLGLTVALMLPSMLLNLKPYQKDRIATFINPTLDPLGAGYNVIQSMIAVGSGMIFGRGLGHGPQSHLKFLPERHTDFIFAAIAEELGFIGSLILVLSYGALLYMILKIADSARDMSGRLICLGAFLMILSQVFINIGMTMGLMPITGITLPLISAGGSSLIATCIALGLVQSVSLVGTVKEKYIEIR